MNKHKVFQGITPSISEWYESLGDITLGELKTITYHLQKYTAGTAYKAEHVQNYFHKIQFDLGHEDFMYNKFRLLNKTLKILKRGEIAK